MNRHVARVRVRYAETDRMNVVHHASYIVWFEVGRSELMRAAGIPYRELEDVHGLLFPVIEVGASYRQPVSYDEEIEVRTTCTTVSPVRVRFDYEIARPGADRVLATGFTVHACVGRETGRLARMPAWLTERLAP